MSPLFLLLRRTIFYPRWCCNVQLEIVSLRWMTVERASTRNCPLRVSFGSFVVQFKTKSLGRAKQNTATMKRKWYFIIELFRVIRSRLWFVPFYGRPLMEEMASRPLAYLPPPHEPTTDIPEKMIEDKCKIIIMTMSIGGNMNISVRGHFGVDCLAFSHFVQYPLRTYYVLMNGWSNAGFTL